MKTKKTCKAVKYLRNSFLFYFLFINSFFTNSMIFSQVSENSLLSSDYSEKGYHHIENLVEIGLRPAGSENEMKAAEYIKNQFLEMGLSTEIETFDYKSFEFESLDLEINEEHFIPNGLGFMPYENKMEYNGKAFLIDSKKSFDIYPLDSIAGNTIISNNFTSHFKLMSLQPDHIIYLDSTEFRKLKAGSALTFKLKIMGKYQDLKSPNVIAQIGESSSQKKEIIIGAHLDSYRTSPGASDNGSGVGSIIELARYFKKMENDLNCVIRFISFGAEELGILGSRKYVEMHKESLKKCVLYYNIDDVGGNGLGAIETLGGVIEAPEKLKDDLSISLAQNPWEGVNSYWRILPAPYIMGFVRTINHPQWLVDIITNSVDESGYEIHFAENLGADQMSFAHEGIVSTSIGITCDRPHTPYDNLDLINKASLQKAGEISVNYFKNQ